MTDINTTSIKLEVVRVRQTSIRATSVKLEVIRATGGPPPAAVLPVLTIIQSSS